MTLLAESMYNSCDSHGIYLMQLKYKIWEILNPMQKFTICFSANNGFISSPSYPIRINYSVFTIVLLVPRPRIELGTKL